MNELVQYFTVGNNGSPLPKKIMTLDSPLPKHVLLLELKSLHKNALAEVDTFTVVNNKGSMELVIGYSSMNTNRVTIPVNCDGTLTDNVSFSAKYFKDVLVANKECGSATLEVSSKGLSRINFKVDDYDVTYFMVAIDEVD